MEVVLARFETAEGGTGTSSTGLVRGTYDRPILHSRLRTARVSVRPSPRSPRRLPVLTQWC